MQTTTLLVKVSTPQGRPAKGATVTARLSSVGIDALGYIDKSHAEAKTDFNGVASLELWPSSTGATDAEYRITARGSDGGRLIDALVTIPESTTSVWLHDIVMLPPPAAKPYDEASIQAIQQARISAANSATNANDAQGLSRAYSVSSAANIAAAQTLLIDVNGLAVEAAESARDSNAAKLIALSASELVAQNKLFVEDKANQVDANAGAALLAVQDSIALFGGLNAVTQAVASSQSNALASEQSNQSAKEHADQVQINTDLVYTALQTVQQNTQSVISSTEKAATSASTALDYLNSTQDIATTVESTAVMVEEDKLSAQLSAQAATQGAKISLDRSSALIAHAENMRIEIGGHRAATDQALTDATNLLGSAEAIDEAVQVTYANRSIVDVSASEAMINTLAVRDAAAASRANRDKSDASAKEAKISELAAKSSLDDVSQLATYAAISAFQTAADRSVTQTAADRSESNLISIQASAVSVAANTVIATQKASEAAASKDASKLSEQASEQSRILSSQASVSAITHKQAAIAAASIAVDGAQLVESLAIQVASDKEAAGQSAMAAAQVAADALNSSNTLIQQAQAASLDISESASLVSAATSNAIALLGGVEAVDEAVQLTYANRAIIDIALSNNLIILSKVKP